MQGWNQCLPGYEPGGRKQWSWAQATRPQRLIPMQATMRKFAVGFKVAAEARSSAEQYMDQYFTHPSLFRSSTRSVRWSSENSGSRAGMTCGSGKERA